VPEETVTPIAVEIEAEIVIDADVTVVWTALTDGIGQWWSHSFTDKPYAVVLDPLSAVASTNSSKTYQLEPAGDQTVVRTSGSMLGDISTRPAHRIPRRWAETVGVAQALRRADSGVGRIGGQPWSTTGRISTPLWVA
jgi:hypothetical protein